MTRTLTTLPAIEQAFTDCPVLVEELAKRRITSLLELSLIPRATLKQIEGMKPSSISHIVHVLEKYELRQREPGQNLVDFIYKYFSCVEEMPAGVLKTILLDSRLPFLNLRTLQVLEAVEPELTVLQLVYKSRDGLRQDMKKLIEGGVDIPDLEEDLRQLSAALGYFDLMFATERIDTAAMNELIEREQASRVPSRHLSVVK